MPDDKFAKRVEIVCRGIPDRGELGREKLAMVLVKLDEIRGLLLGSPVEVETTKNRELIGVLEIVINEKKPAQGGSS